MSAVNLSEETLLDMLGAKTWMLPNEALEMGFATSIAKAEQSNKAAAPQKALFSMVKNNVCKSAKEAKPRSKYIT